MKAWPFSSLLILVILGLFIPVYSAADPCPTCSEFVNAPQAGIFVQVYSTDPANRHLEITAYYDNISASPSRQPLANSIILIELSNQSGLYELRKTYTDDQGNAVFNFDSWGGGCVNFKVLYCPYCIPPDAQCSGFKQCLDFSNIQTNATSASEIIDAFDAHAPASLNPTRFLPQFATGSYCPPPPPLAATPALCFPLILIFSLLGGALYLSGRNPFAAFNIGGMRVGQHIRYQARGRGFSFSATQALMSTATIAQAGVTAGKGGMGALVKKEVTAMSRRDPLGRTTIKQAVAQGRSFSSAAALARTAAKAKAAGLSGSGTGGQERRQGTTLPGGGQTPSSIPFAPGSTTPMPLGGVISGSQLMGGSTLWSGTSRESMGRIASFLFLRIPLFLVMNTTLGRAIDSIVVAATYNREAQRGSGVFELAFANRSQSVAEAASTLFAVRGAHGGLAVSYTDSSGVEHLVEVSRSRDTSLPEGQARVTIQRTDQPAGARDQSITLTIDERTHRVLSADINVLPEGAAAGAVPITYRITRNDDGSMTVARIISDPGAPGSDPRSRTTRAEPVDSATQQQVLGYGLLAGFTPGSQVQPFIQAYQAHFEAFSALASSVQGDLAMEAARREADGRGHMQSPESRELVREARFDAAVTALAAAIGVDPQTLRAGGVRVDLVGETHGVAGTYESVAARVYEADQHASGERDPWSGEQYRFTTDLVRCAVGSVPERSRALATDILSSVVASMTPEQLTKLSQTQLLSLVGDAFDSRLNAARGGLTQDQIHEREALRSQLLGDLQRSDFVGQTRGMAADFQETLRQAHLSDTLTHDLMGANLSVLSGLSGAGRLMSDDHATELLASRPEYLSRPGMPDGLAQAVREFAFIHIAGDAAGSVASGNMDAAGRFPAAAFDYLQAGMVTVARDLHAFSDTPSPDSHGHESTDPPEYSLVASAMDAGIHQAALESQFGIDRLPISTPATPSESPQPGSATPAAPGDEEAQQQAARDAYRAQVERAVGGAEWERPRIINDFVSVGDYSSARAEIARAVSEYEVSAAAAHALGGDVGTQAEEQLRQAAAAYAGLYLQIDRIESASAGRRADEALLPQPTAEAQERVGRELEARQAQLSDARERLVVPPSLDSSTLSQAVADVSLGLASRRTDDFNEARQRMEARIPQDVQSYSDRLLHQPDSRYWSPGADEPLTPTTGGLTDPRPRRRPPQAPDASGSDTA